ncbi:bacterial low temperature requirement A protein-domain-containing protein [Halenospora varia]|nr:bacterial low temperature requirement A protein-domain-containing protein [Halenospora varia]
MDHLNVKHRTKGLKWLATPLVDHNHHEEHEMHSHGHGSGHHSSDESTPALKPNQEGYAALPEFHRHEEATNIELFFDLFFVANLAGFSNVHEINDKGSLTSYIGFFCVLWFTWCQVSLFDVRFVADSVMERLAKAIHLGVMVGLAVVGPGFDPGDQKRYVFRTMSLILMISRLTLACQYLLVMWHVRKFRNTKMPFLLIAGSNVLAAIIYLGVTFAFKTDGNKTSVAYRSFYVIAIFELVVNIAVSSRWKVVSFKGTHLTQRMSLLTLIIIGEGVIVTCKTISKLVTYHDAWNAETVGCVIASVMIIYFLYMLYFDALPPHHFGSIRQQFWAYLHFPLHLALVLFLVGVSQFFIWNKITQAKEDVIARFNELTMSGEFSNTLDTNDYQTMAAWLRDLIFNKLLDKKKGYKPKDSIVLVDLDHELTILQQGWMDDGKNTTNSGEWVMDQVNDMAQKVIKSVFKTYGFEAPEKKGNAATNHADGKTVDTDQAFSDMITLVFTYFFVAAGATLILLGVLDILTLPRHHFTKSIWRNIGIVVSTAAYFVIGIALMALSSLADTDAGDNWGATPWILVVPAFAIIIVVVMRYMMMPGSKTVDH